MTKLEVLLNEFYATKDKTLDDIFADFSIALNKDDQVEEYEKLLIFLNEKLI